MMRTLSIASILLAVPLGMFAMWGLNTSAGRHAFDEMDGIYPAAAGLASVLLLLIAVLAFWRYAVREDGL